MDPIPREYCILVGFRKECQGQWLGRNGAHQWLPVQNRWFWFKIFYQCGTKHRFRMFPIFEVILLRTKIRLTFIYSFSVRKYVKHLSKYSWFLSSLKNPGTGHVNQRLPFDLHSSPIVWQKHFPTRHFQKSKTPGHQRWHDESRRLDHVCTGIRRTLTYSHRNKVISEINVLDRNLV